MPKLWSKTIEEHRHEVREAIMNTAWLLATTRGPLSVTMSQIANESGIGRATLYKYFPDVETILRAKHEQHVFDHLRCLNEASQGDDGAKAKLESVSLLYAQMCHRRRLHGTVELSVLLHKPQDMSGAESAVLTLFEELLVEAAASGDVRDDTPPSELTAYVVHALGAANRLPTDAAVRRLVGLTLAALRT